MEQASVDISVIIPVYNAESYIGECLQGILSARGPRIEVICVDDGSTDNTAALLQQMSGSDPRIRVYSSAHAGAGAARNVGMQHAAGSYLSFLDADDFFDPDMLELAWNKARGNNLDLVVFPSDNYFMDTLAFSESQGCLRSLLPEKRPFSGTDVPRDIFRLFIGWAWDKLFRTAFVRQTGLSFAELPSSNDLSFTFAAIAAAPRMDWLDGAPLAHHRRYSGSISTGRDKTWDCFYHALLELRENLRKLNLYNRFERDFVNYCLYFSLWQMTTVSEDTGRRIWNKLVREWFDEFGLAGRPKGYFYQPEYYTAMRQMEKKTPEEYLPRISRMLHGPASPLQAGSAESSGPARRVVQKFRTAVWLLRRNGVKTVLQYGSRKLQSVFRHDTPKKP